jgi:hypothetical protein
MVVTYVTWAAAEASGARYRHIASAVPLALALLRFGMLTGRRTVRPVEDILTRDGLLLACEAAWLALFTAGLSLGCRERRDASHRESNLRAWLRGIAGSSASSMVTGGFQRAGGDCLLDGALGHQWRAWAEDGRVSRGVEVDGKVLLTWAGSRTAIARQPRAWPWRATGRFLSGAGGSLSITRSPSLGCRRA